jgi:hypothetical protein
LECVSRLITQKLEAMVEAADSDLVISKRKAINTLLPYAICLEQGGQQTMMDTISRVARVSRSSKNVIFMWHQVVLYISKLFETRSPTSLNRVIVLISPYVPWTHALNSKIPVARWAAAASTIPYTEEVGSSVVDALFRIAWVDLLLPHIPIHIWLLLKRLPPPPLGSSIGRPEIVRHVHRIGDIDILKSYFLFLWTDLYTPSSEGTHAMRTSIREVFSGPEMGEHRKDLIERLEHVLGQLDQELETSPDNDFSQQAKRRYTKLKDTLLEMSRS